MKVREEIEKYADEKDKPILLWLFERYHMESEWRIMASCEFVKDPSQKQWGAHRRWFPQGTGLALYENAQLRRLLSYAARYVVTVGVYDQDKQRLIAEIEAAGVKISDIPYGNKGAP